MRNKKVEKKFIRWSKNNQPPPEILLSPFVPLYGRGSLWMFVMGAYKSGYVNGQRSGRKKNLFAKNVLLRDIRKRMITRYGNKPSLCSAGHSHASKLESSVCQMLQLRIRAKEIDIVQCQDHVYLTEARILYIPDFKCTTRDKKEFFVEAKGFETPEWKLKKKLWKFYGPAPLEIWMGSHTNPFLKETLTPEKK